MSCRQPRSQIISEIEWKKKLHYELQYNRGSRYLVTAISFDDCIAPSHIVFFYISSVSVLMMPFVNTTIFETHSRRLVICSLVYSKHLNFNNVDRPYTTSATIFFLFIKSTIVFASSLHERTATNTTGALW